MPRLIHRTALATLAALSLGCPKQDGDPLNVGQGTGNGANWAIALVADHTDLSIQQGASDAVTVTVSRIGGFTGEVTFSSLSTNPNVIPVFSNIVTTGTTTTALATIPIPGSTGTAPLTVTVQAQSPTDRVMGVFVDLHITVTLKPGIFIGQFPAVTVGRGGVVGQPVNFSRTLFTDDVPLSLVNAPTGITATFSPNPVTNPGTTSSMTLSADATVVEGVYTGGVRANAGLPGQATAPFSITVTPPPALAFSLNPSPMSIARGASAATTVTITRSNFSQPVALVVTGLPAGSFASFPPTSGNTGTLTLNIGAGAPPGPYALMVTSSGLGVPVVAVPLALTITP